VAGISALLMQKEPQLTADQVKARLMATAIDLGEHPCVQGQGRIDALRAIHDEQGEAPDTGDPNDGSPGDGTSPRPGCLTSVTSLFTRRHKG